MTDMGVLAGNAIQQSFFLINGHSALPVERGKTRSPTKFLSTYIIQCLVSIVNLPGSIGVGNQS